MGRDPGVFYYGVASSSSGPPATLSSSVMSLLRVVPGKVRRCLGTLCMVVLGLLLMGAAFAWVSGSKVDVILNTYLDEEMAELEAAISAHKSGRTPKSSRKLAVQEKRGFLEPAGLPSCTADLVALSGFKGAEAWSAKRRASLQNRWSSFSEKLPDRLDRQRYCVAQCGIGQCCPGKDGWRIGGKPSWYVVLKDDTDEFGSPDDGMSEVSDPTLPCHARPAALAVDANAVLRCDRRRVTSDRCRMYRSRWSRKDPSTGPLSSGSCPTPGTGPRLACLPF